MWRGPGDCLCSSPQEGSRAEETTPPRVPTPSSSLFPLEHPSPPPSCPGPEPLPGKRVSHPTPTITSPLQHFPIATTCVIGSDAGLLTPEHASPPKPHCV